MTTHTPTEIVRKINEYIVKYSGFEERRNYVSISHLGECSRRIVREFMNGFTVESHTHHMCYAGYEQETSIRNILLSEGMFEQMNVEVTAPFDSRLKGHMDGVWDGQVIEIKSLSNHKWRRLEEKGDRCLWKHFIQVQMYMHYSGLRQAMVIYRNRDTYQHMVIMVRYQRDMAEKYENKARDILRAIDDNCIPECECGLCKE